MRDIWKKLGVSMEKKGNRNREYRMERGQRNERSRRIVRI